MICTYVRSSSYNQYDYCQQSYFINYVLGWPSESNKRADLGTMAHKVMEGLAALKQYEQEKPKAKKLSITDDVLGKLSISKDTFRTNEFVESLSDLSFNNYIEKFSTHKWSESDRKEVYKISRIFIDHNGGQFDPRYRRILAPEQHFDIEIEEDWAKFQHQIDGKLVEGRLAIKGTIDLMTLVNEETIEVIDWKSGRRMNWATGEEKCFKKLSEDPQLMLYFYAISKLFPQYPNKIMSIFFCKSVSGAYDPKPFSLCFDESTSKIFLGMLEKRFKDIQMNQSPKLLDPRRYDFKCKKMCTYCKSNWPGTEQSMCSYIEQSVRVNGMESTVADCTKPGFQIGFYESPG